MQEGPVSYGTDALEPSTSNNIAGPKTRRFAVLFELLPSKIFYVPLYFAYNCRLYIAPQNLKYFPSLVFDIRGWNLGKDDIKEVNCKRLPDPTVPIDQETIYEDNEKLLVSKIPATETLKFDYKNKKFIALFFKGWHQRHRVYQATSSQRQKLQKCHAIHARKLQGDGLLASQAYQHFTFQIPHRH